jgi:hypothetical protein
MPTTLTAQQLAEIKNECQDIGQPASYEIAIADNRAERGFIILKADRGPDYKPTLNRYATIMCRYEMQDGVLTTPSIFLAETPSLGNAYSWGAEELGNQKVWIFLSSVEANVTKVEITTAQGMVLQASLTNGFTLAWWPRLAEAGADANATTNAFVRFYDSAGNLVKTFSMLTGQTTKP